MLGFRSLFRTHDTPQLVPLALLEFRAWLTEKGYDPDLIRGEHPVPVADGVLGSVQHHVDDVGSTSVRARLVEHAPEGVWTSELTVHNSPTGNRGWVWLDIHKPDDHGWTRTPRLARRLVARLPVRDGAHLLADRPRVVREAGVDRVVAALNDPTRRGLAFVAGSGGATSLEPWRERVAGLLRDTTGLANGWVLDPAATERFTYLVRREHGVTAGALRTYLPGVVPGNTLDAQRHRFLTRTTIARAPVGRVRRLLGQRARDQMITGRLPDTLRDLDRILRRRVDEDLLDELFAARPLSDGDTARPADGHGGAAVSERPVVVVPPVRPGPDRPQPVPPDPSRAEPGPAEPGPSDPETPEPAAPQPTTEPAAPPARPAPVSPVTGEPEPAQPPAESPAAAADGLLARVLRTVFGTADVTAQSVDELERLAVGGRRTATTRDRIDARLTQLREMAEEADLARELAADELEIERRERAEVEEQRAEAERQLRHLRGRLAALGEAETAWTVPELDDRDLRPETFVDLLAQIGTLRNVEFTGDEEITLGLDKHATPAWAGKAWDALLALDDYARVSAGGGFPGDVAAFLADTPAACHGFSARRHAFTESEEVHNTPRLRAPRTLPVPVAVHPSGRAFMAAHFKIAQSARVSPRLHYLDETARSGRVYVGYLGPHLPLGSDS